MNVIGIGFRGAATLDSLQDAFAQIVATAPDLRVEAVVSEAAKSREAVFREFAQSVGLPGLGVSQTDLAQMITPTQSQRIQDRFGTGSLAEAAALAAAGPKARLVVSRVVSTDGMATAALAEG